MIAEKNRRIQFSIRRRIVSVVVVASRNLRARFSEIITIRRKPNVRGPSIRYRFKYARRSYYKTAETFLFQCPPVTDVKGITRVQVIRPSVSVRSDSVSLPARDRSIMTVRSNARAIFRYTFVIAMCLRRNRRKKLDAAAAVVRNKKENNKYDSDRFGRFYVVVVVTMF